MAPLLISACYATATTQVHTAMPPAACFSGCEQGNAAARPPDSLLPDVQRVQHRVDRAWQPPTASVHGCSGRHPRH